jgi:hypothetical protein
MFSHYVTFKFPMGPHQVPTKFPNMFSIAHHFYPICFGKCRPPFPYIGGPKGMNFILPKKTIGEVP